MLFETHFLQLLFIRFSGSIKQNWTNIAGKKRSIRNCCFDTVIFVKNCLFRKNPCLGLQALWQLCVERSKKWSSAFCSAKKKPISAVRWMTSCRSWDTPFLVQEKLPNDRESVSATRFILLKMARPSTLLTAMMDKLPLN